MTDRRLLTCPECRHTISVLSTSLEPSTPCCEEHGHRIVHYIDADVNREREEDDQA